MPARYEFADPLTLFSARRTLRCHRNGLSRSRFKFLCFRPKAEIRLTVLDEGSCRVARRSFTPRRARAGLKRLRCELGGSGGKRKLGVRRTRLPTRPPSEIICFPSTKRLSLSGKSGSNPRGHNEEGWNSGRYCVYHDLDSWRRYTSAAGFVELTHITALTACRENSSPGWRASGAFAHRFNHHRPHDSLAGQTPAEYLRTLGQGDRPPSHM
jgi:hypothetical protein